MLLVRQTGGSREPWGHSSWCLRSNTIKMYVSFIPMPAPSLCHFSGPPDFRGEQNHFNESSSDTKCRRTPRWGDGMQAWDNTVQHFLYIICTMQQLLYFMCKGNTSNVWICLILHMKKRTKTVFAGEEKRERQHAYESSPSWFFVCVCLAHIGDTANVLSRFLCGVSVLAQGSDLRGHGVLVMPPRLAVPICPQSVCKQIKRRGLFN